MENPAILLRRLNPYCARAMEGAASLCQTRAHAEILPEHWLLKLLEQGEGDLTVLARRYEWDMDAIWQALLGFMDAQPRSVRSRPQLSENIQALMQDAWLHASLAGEEHIRSIHLLMALVEKPKQMRCDGLWPLLTLGQSQLERLRGLLDAQSDERPEVQHEAELVQGSEVEFVGRPVNADIKDGALNPVLQNALDKFTLDVTDRAREGKIDPVFGRDNEIRQMVDNHTRNVLRTPANNKLRMEDRRGEEHIRLATEFGKTQLNAGHLVDAQEKPRGKGFELRTDEHGVIRVAKGLFITADGQQKAAGEVLDMETALKEIDVCLQQLQQLEKAAEQAQALKADIESQIQMFEKRLKPLNETLLFSAPEGMAFTSGEHLQMTAAKNVAIDAGGDISTGVMGNMTVLAGAKLGLFARTGQLSLKAGEGPIDVQAQNASMRLFAEKKLTMSSASDISFAGKKRITLIGGGSYLRLEAGKVEYGTTAMYLRKVKRTMAAASNSLEQDQTKLPAPLPDLSCGPNVACFRISDALTGAEDMEFAYQVNTPTGALQGRTDSALTPTVNSDTEENVLLDYVFQIRAGTR